MALYQRLKRQILSKTWLMRGLLVVLVFAFALALYFLAIKPLGHLTASLPSHSGRTNFYFRHGRWRS